MTISSMRSPAMATPGTSAAPVTRRQAGVPYLIRQNAAVSRRDRSARYRGTTPDGTKFEILEKDYQGNWFLVSVFTVINGRRH